MNILFRRLALAIALCPPLLALAQAGNTDPAKADAPAPQLQYRSAFADYKRWQDTKPGDWKALNDAAGKSGGHSMSIPTGSATAPAPAASKPAMPDHSGHQMHMQGGKK